MAAILGFNLTTAAESIRTEQINPDLIAAPSIVRAYEGFTYIVDASMGKSGKYRWVSLDDATISGSQTETDELAATDFGLSKKEATAGVVGRRHFVSKQALQDSSIDATGIFNDLAEKVRNRVNKDVCSLASGAATDSNFTGEELTLDNLDEAYADFLALNPSCARHVLVLSQNQLAHVRKGIRNSGNGGLIMGAGLDVFNGRTLSAYQGNWGQIEMWVGNMPDNGVSDVSAMFVCADAPGSKSGVGLAVWWPATPEVQPAATRVGLELVVTSRYAVSITADYLVHEVITKKAI